MTQYEEAEGTTHVPQPAASRPAFRFNGYGVPMDADPVETEPEADDGSPYRYDAYGPQHDPYVHDVPYDEPADPYVPNVPYDEPADPYVPNVPYDEPAVVRSYAEPREAESPEPPAPRPEPAWSPAVPEPEPVRAAREPEPVFVARFEPVVEPPPAPPREREPDTRDVSWPAEVPSARFEPERPAAPEPEPQPLPIAAAYAEAYVHAYVAAEPADALARQAPPRQTAPARARTEEPAVVARTAYRPAAHAGNRVADESRERTWALISHIGGLLTGFLVPLVTFLVYRKRSQFLREHTTEALNFQLMLAIVYVAGAALTVLFFGIFVLVAAWVFAVTFGTLGALAANDGDGFRYPVNLRVIA
ncbi:MAG TPA: DUF4870 domain-containing protein [Streptosporangiales bacterium]